MLRSVGSILVVVEDKKYTSYLRYELNLLFETLFFCHFVPVANKLPCFSRARGQLPSTPSKRLRGPFFSSTLASFRLKAFPEFPEIEISPGMKAHVYRGWNLCVRMGRAYFVRHELAKSSNRLVAMSWCIQGREAGVLGITARSAAASASETAVLVRD